MDKKTCCIYAEIEIGNSDDFDRYWKSWDDLRDFIATEALRAVGFNGYDWRCECDTNALRLARDGVASSDCGDWGIEPDDACEIERGTFDDCLRGVAADFSDEIKRRERSEEE